MEYRLAQRIINLKLSATDEIDNTVKKMQRKGINDIISFGGGEPCFDTPLTVQEGAIAGLRGGKTKYEPTAGDYELREEISKKLKQHNQINAGVEDIIVTPGGKFAVYLASQVLLQPGDKVMVLEPAWVSYVSNAELAGAEVIHIPSYEENGFQPDLDLIRKKMDKSVRYIVMNSPSNPTGAVYAPDTIREIARIAQQYGALILSDEIYEDILYQGERFSPGSEFDNVITINGFSKTYAMTGWRLGYVTAPREIIDGMIKIYQQSATCVTAFAQSGAIDALRDPKAAADSQKMIEGYRQRCELISDLIKESGFFKGFVPQGAFYAFPSYTFNRSSLEVANLMLEKAHVATVPGSAFGDCGERHIRFSYSTSKENIIEGFHRITRIADQLAKES
jgi:aspartate aminotransferase